MNAEGSECSGGTCVSGTVCSLRELAVGSEWKRAAESTRHGHRCCSPCVEFVVQKAVQEQQWDCAVQLSENCSVQQRSEVVRALTAHGQWGGVAQLMKLSVTSETVRAVVQHAVQEGQWVWIREMLETGLCGQELEWLCEQAVDRQQWDVVMQLVEMGVHTALRNKVWQSALLHRHVPCTAKLIELGVSHWDREDSIGKEIASGQCEFVLHVVKMVQDPELTNVVLQESLKQKQWPLVGKLVKEGLSVAQMGAACDQAVADRQWTVALQLLQGGVSASQWMVDEFFENHMAPALLDLFPAGCVSDSLRGLLLMGSIRHGQGDFTLRLLQQLSVSDTELMEAMKYAVHLLDKTMLLLIIRASSRSRRVFKQKFIHQDWKENLQLLEYEHDRGDGGEIRWLFETFYTEGEKDLALYVASSNTREAYLIRDFCENEKHDFNLKQRKRRYALRKLFEVDHNGYVRFVEDLYKMPETPQSDRSFLFRQAIRFGQFDLATSLCGHGVSRKDLKLAVHWFFQSDQYGGGSYAFIKVCWKVSEEDRVWLNQYTIRFAMRQYFQQQSGTCLKRFVELFVGCHNKQFTRQIFREAVRKCVDFDCVDCFVQLCRKQLSVYSLSEHGEVWEDCTFAYTCAVTGNRPHFIERICEERMTKQSACLQNRFHLIIDIIVEKEAWNLLPSVSAGFIGLSWSEGPLDVLEYCAYKMLTDWTTWPCMAPVLDQWIEKLEINVQGRLRVVYNNIVKDQWPVSLSSLKEWCVDTGHANLAFFLALVSGDWRLIETLVNTQTTLRLHQSVLMGGVGMAAEAFASSAGAAILKMCPISAENVARVKVDIGLEQLVKACEEEELLDWALIVNRFDVVYVEAHHGQCQNPVVLNCILKTAAQNSLLDSDWELSRQLMTRCTDTQTLTYVLKKAVKTGQVDIAETLISRVDPSRIGNIYLDHGTKTLLFLAVTAGYGISDDRRLNMVRLCVASGLSTVQREMPFVDLPFAGTHNCPLLGALSNGHLNIIELLLASGACSYERLHSIRRDRDMERRSIQRRDPGSEKWRTAYRCVLEAAATPSTLLHMARLVVSRSIGCRPGRPERIQALPLPEAMKELLRFKDALTVDSKKTSEEEK